MRKILWLSLIFLWVLPLSPLQAQGSKDPSAKIPEKVEELSLYQRSVQKAALEISLFPSLLEKLSKIQMEAITQFKKVISGFPKDKQKQIYEISRFPKLINEIDAGGKKTPKEVKQILKTYPKEIHSIVQDFAKNNFDLFTQINNINRENNKKFEQAIQGYPPEAQKAFLVLLQHPTALRILYKNMHYSALAGKTLQERSEIARKKVAALSKELREENAKVRDGKMAKIEQDPKSSPALKKAAHVFASETNYVMSSDEDSKGAVQVNIKFNPYWYGYLGGYGMGLYNYPYWYGFPGWGFDGGWNNFWY